MEKKAIIIACDGRGEVLWVFAYPSFTVGELTHALSAAQDRVQEMVVLSAVERHSLSNVVSRLVAALEGGVREGRDGESRDG